MRTVIVSLVVGLLASVACGGTIPTVDWSSVDLGGGLTGYTFSADDGVTTGSWACELTFAGVEGALINQLKAFAVFDINTEAEAISYEAITGSGYTQALDSWAYGPFDGIGPPPQFDETSTSYYVHAGTPGGVDVGATNVAYVVSDGNIGWDGTISRGGVDYDTSGVTPEPVTALLLAIGAGLGLLRCRK